MPSPRIAFTGEEFGFGYQAAGAFVKALESRRGRCLDGGESLRRGHRHDSHGIDSTDARNRFDYHQPNFQPLRTREQALFAIKNKDADVAIAPFYSPSAGYDLDTLKALSNQVGYIATEQVEATDHYCLAVFEPQVLELAQAAHPGSAFSDLQKLSRRSWKAHGASSFDPRYVEMQDSGEMYGAGLQLDAAAQLMLRERIDLVFAGPEAMNRCKSKLDGLRASGVEIKALSGSVEPHREMARMARTLLDANRQTHTSYDPSSGRTTFHSSMSAEAQNAKLFGVIVPFDVADKSPNFTIIEPYLEDSDPPKTRFFAIRSIFDMSLFRHGFKELVVGRTRIRSGYWMKRLQSVAHSYIPHEFSLWDIAAGLVGCVFWAAAIGFLFFGLVGLTYPSFQSAGVNLDQYFAALGSVSKWLHPVTGAWAILISFAALVLGRMALKARSLNDSGTRVMFRFERGGAAASIGNIQDFLRKHGVRHAVVQPVDDAEASTPSPVILDVEFSPRDFRNSVPLGNDSIVAKTLRRAFAEWKRRNPWVVAAVPFRADSGHQLPRAMRRTPMMALSYMLDSVASQILAYITLSMMALMVMLMLIVTLFPAAGAQILKALIGPLIERLAT